MTSRLRNDRRASQRRDDGGTVRRGWLMVSRRSFGICQLTFKFTDAGLEHLVLSGQHLRLCLVESALITVGTEQPILALVVVR